MNEFSIQVCSDLDYEGMVVDICNSEGRIATISCDTGPDKVQMVIFDKKNENPVWIVDFNLFKDVMEKAFIKLKESNL